MPQLIPPLIIATTAAATAAVITSQVQKGSAEKALKAQKEQAQKQLKLEEDIAQEQAVVMETGEEAALAVREKEIATHEKLTEEQMMLEAQRSQIDTLFNVMQTQRLATETSAPQPQYFPAPQPVRQPQSFVSQINSWIDNLFRGR